MVGRELEALALGLARVRDGHGTDRDLHEQVELLRPGGGVGGDDLAAVDGAGEELAADELVHLLAVFHLVAVVR